MLAAIAGAGYLAWKAYKKAGEIAQGVQDVATTTLNPGSTENVVYKNTPDFVKEGLFKFYSAIGL